MNNQFEMILASVLSGLMGLVPLLVLVLGIASTLGKHRALRTFVPVEAVVVSAQIIVWNNFDSTDYRPAIEYEYEVEGSIYRSTTIWSGTGVQSAYHFLRKTQVQDLLDQYPVGQTVPAFRDPGDPTQAFLIRKHPFLHEHLLTIFFGGFGSLLCFGCSIGFAREAGILWELIGGIGLISVLIAVLFRWLARQAKRNEDKN